MSWTIKKAEHWRNDAFNSFWRRLLRVPWTARRSNQSILNEINSEYSLEGLMLKLKFLILWSPYVKSLLTEKEPDAGNNWGQEEKRTTEDKVVEWCHQFNGHELGQTQRWLRDQEVWCAAINGFTELDMTCWLNNSDNGSVEAMGFFFFPCLEFFLL